MTPLMKTLVLMVVCGGLVLKAAPPATAQTHAQLQAQIAQLAVRVLALESQLAAVASDTATNTTNIAALPALSDCMDIVSVSGQAVDDVVFRGCNVHVQNGSGSTASSNGVGNLIIGYNESGAGSPARGGSHNVVIGPQHSYSSYGGLVAGYGNTVSGLYASVSGGNNNEASGTFASVSGGKNNEASGSRSSVSGGYNNTASNYYASVSGGVDNEASDYHASVSGGSGNDASDTAASVSGGRDNEASGLAASVSGGRYNEASGDYASVSGGNNRTASGQHDWRAGGLFQNQ